MISYLKKNNLTKATAVLLFLFFVLHLLPNTVQRTKAEDSLQLSAQASTWSDGYNVSMTIKNTSGSAVNGWTLVLNTSDFTITNTWCVKVTVSGDSIVITPDTWNRNIPINGNITFGFTGQGNYNSNFHYTLRTSSSVITPTSIPTNKPTPTPRPTNIPTPTPKPTSIPTPTPGPTPTTVPYQAEIPSFSSLVSNEKLPNPFLFKTGSKKGTTVANASDWETRRSEIIALAQAFEFGVNPGKPDSVTGSFQSNKITVSCTNNGKTISFQCSIQYPSNGMAPYPAMIGVNMNNLNTNELLKMGVALITFPADEIGQQVNASSRGRGKFFDLYGSNYNAGALMTWTWGVDRLIDALETTPQANINPQRLGVTGGSRNGKGALTIGAFSERIALTVPQESGNGGASGWRTADAQKASGQNVQTLSQIITENCWFSTSLNQFSGQTNKLPYDHHEIMALCAPRGLLVIENPDFEWLGDLSGFNTSTAGRMIYESLGVKNNMGYSSVGGHGHCVFPDSQLPELRLYVRKFLLDEQVDTNLFRSAKNYSFDKQRWVNWTLPTIH